MSLVALEDGRLASGSDDCAVKLWDLARRKRIATFETEASPTTLAFSPDGWRLASAAGRTGYIWSVETHFLTTLDGHQGQVKDVAFRGDGDLVETAGCFLPVAGDKGDGCPVGEEGSGLGDLIETEGEFCSYGLEMCVIQRLVIHSVRSASSRDAQVCCSAVLV